MRRLSPMFNGLSAGLAKRAFLLLIILGLAGVQLDAQNNAQREADRKAYETTVINSYNGAAFFDIPWLVLFNDGRLSFRAVETLFNEKKGSMDLREVDRKLFNKWILYRDMSLSAQKSDGSFRYPDDDIKDLKKKKGDLKDNLLPSSNFNFIGQSSSVFNTNNGRIERVNFHPTNTNIIWASAPEGGLWRSTDAGDSWTLMSDFWDHLSVGDLVYNTNDPDTLYVATDDHDSWFNANRGVLRSDDGGATWNIVGLPYSMAQDVYKLMMHPDGRTLFACTNQGLFKSTNHGVTWVKNAALPSTTQVNDLEFKPGNSQVMYVTARGGGSPNYGYFFVSTDGGATFTQKTAPMNSKGRTTQVCVSPDDPNIAYIGIYPEPPSYTTQGGMIMKYQFDTDNLTIVTDLDYVFPNIWVGGAWDFRIEVDPANADHLVYSCVFNYESMNGGATWTYVPALHADVHDIKWQAGTNRWWIADDGGLGVSTNGGTSWTTIENLPVMQWYSVQSSRMGEYKILGAQDAGVHMEMNGNWFLPMGGDGLEVKVDPVDSNTLYGSVQTGLSMRRIQYYPPTQSVSHNEIMNLDKGGGEEATWRQEILIDAADRNTLYTNYRDIFKSTDHGSTWVNITNGTLGNGQTNINFIVQSKSDPNVLVTGWYPTLKRSTDGGQTWNTVTYPLFISDQNSLIIKPTDPNTMWACGSGQVKKTTDGGMTWTNYTGSLPPAAGVYNIAYQEGTADGLYVGGLLGNVYYRDNNTGDWVLHNNNLPRVRVQEIEVLPHLGTLRVATWGRGVWESPLHTASSGLCVEPVPPAISVQQCGNTATLTIPAAPSGYNIVWYKEDVLLNGETGTTLPATIAGKYRARYLQTSGTCHSYFSDPVLIEFNATPAILSGKGLDFDGVDDYVELPANQIDLRGKSFTVEFWAKRPTLGGGDLMLDMGSSANNNRLHIGFRSSNEFTFAFYGNDLNAAPGYTDTDWHHWACVYDKSISAPNHNRFIYRDGALVASDRTSSDFNGIGTLDLGRAFGGNYFAGVMDEIRIWSVARTQAQVKNQMLCALDCYPSELALYFPVDEGTANGTNTALIGLKDYSSYARFDTLRNFTLNGPVSNIVTGITKLLFQDVDEDGYGDPAMPITSCPTQNYSFLAGDCNDNNANINPYVAEICGNSTDDDCDGNTDSEVNKALHFNGSGHNVSIPNIPYEEFFTVEAWVKPSSVAGWHLRIFEWAGKSSLALYDNKIAWDENGIGSLGGPNLADGQWHHIALVHNGYTGTNIIGYVDGVQAFSTSVAFNATTNATTNIGRNFTGGLDDVRYWNTALTQAQIQARMNLRLDGNETNLVRYYTFDHGQPEQTNTYITSARDKTVNAAHGALSGFTLAAGATSNWVTGKPYALYLDVDNDGFGGQTTWTCGSMTGFKTNNIDCNDNNANINPYVAEICGNSTDDDCDGNTDSEVNKALHFNGSGHNVSIPNIPYEEFFTVEAWVKPSSVAGWHHRIFEWAGKANLALYNNSIAWDESGLGNLGGPNLADGQWHHIALVHNGYTGTNIIGYVDGVQVLTTARAFSATTNSSTNIGRDFTGGLDDVRYWNTALTQTQIQARMNLRLDGNETNLVRYYTFDHGKPGLTNAGMTQARDKTSNNAHGTLSGFALTGSTSNWVTGKPYPALYPDVDNDGFGGPTAWTCGSMTGFKTNNIDCNDNNANINPYAAEICGNSTDDDCDGNTDSEVNKALHFNGSGHNVSIPNIPYEEFFTVEAWVKPSSVTGWHYRIFEWAGKANLALYNNSIVWDENGAGNLGGPNLADGQWHHIALVHNGYTGNNIIGYVDGVQVLTTARAFSATTNSSTNIGRDFTGGLDDVRYWNTALTQTQIQARMNLRLDGNETNLVRYYTFDHGKPGLTNAVMTQARDKTSNNAHGTLSGFALTGSTSNWVAGKTYPVLYADADNDGFGGSTTWTCGSMTGFKTTNTDCNDSNNSVYPNATETCNGLDDNCNGVIDESFANFASTNVPVTIPESGTVTSTLTVSSPVTSLTDLNVLNLNISHTYINDMVIKLKSPQGTEITLMNQPCLNEQGVLINFDDESSNNYGTFPCPPANNGTYKPFQALSAFDGQNPNGTWTLTIIDLFVPDGGTLNAWGISIPIPLNTLYADVDGDGYGDPGVSIQSGCSPAGFVTNDDDCNDNNNAVYPGATEICGNSIDDDCDGQTDENCGDVDNDGFTIAQGDCNDNNNQIYPGATEVCNGVDDNCNGTTDEGVQTTYYADADGDGFGNAAMTTQACSAPSGYVANNTDCNDNNNQVYPGATEVCNGVDDNCNGTTDEGVQTTYYADADGDGFGNAAVTTPACSAPSGYVANNTDCNDSNSAIYPGATEVCNGIDDNCDGMTDEGVKTTYYADADGDGFGNPAVTTQACSAPSGYVANSTDCNDSNNAIYPGATEVCNGIDDNCDGMTDEGVKTTYYADADGDGFGNAAMTTQACSAPSGYVANNTDCNDSNNQVYPGAMELCNGIDDNCNDMTDEGVQTTYYADADGDGFGNAAVTTQACSAPSGYVANSTDCNDNNNTIYPGATEVCNGVDDNCNGTTDEGVQTTYYADADGDGFGNAAVTTQACSAPSGYVANNTDCNDNNNQVYPGATEVCNGIDDNCDGTTDEGVQTTYYADADGDGFGNAAMTTQACSAPSGYVANSTDCNDNNNAIYPGATEVCNGIDDNCDGTTDEGVKTTYYADADGDGFGNAAVTTQACSAPSGYVANSTDCNDNNNAIYPGATEVCNGIDDDCDGMTDEGVQTTYYADADGDGFGNAAMTTQACSAPSGYVANSTDCNDSNNAIYPGATEVCNGVDDNCNGTTDEGVQTTYYADADGDGFGNAAVTTQACSAPSGYVANNTDCNDSNSAIYPGATEVCNGIDDNCDGMIDEGVKTTYYADADGDGFGNAAVTTQACSAPSGYVANNTDCNDSNNAIYPGATEVCNGIDDNCDGTTDEGVQTTYYADADGDGFGNAAMTTQACSAPSGYVANNTDCNDNNNAIYPGATEVCNGVDDNCNGTTDEGVQTTYYADADGDGFGNAAVTTQACSAPSGYVANNTDCNDSNSAIYPGATEVCNGVDDNCNGTTDEGVQTTFYADADGDGFGNAAMTTQACSAPSGYVANNTDCNDSNNQVYPGAMELCNGIDDNCNDMTDEGVQTTFYADADGDGFGNAAVTTQACSAPSGYVADNTDCNDSNNAIYPGATEVCNGIDDNCDGTTDEGVKTTYYADADGDGFGNAAVTTQACSAPSGYVANNTDCNDSNNAIYPGATEVCNGIDDNCDGTTDEGVQTTYYADADGDGFGNAAVTTQACSAPSGYVANNTDCNDSNNAIYPGATEVCNGIDDNCDGTTDEGVQTTYYADADGDGFGNAAVTTQACSAPSGYVANNTDCNDNNNAIYPGATEVCNGVDDNCNGTTDEGVQTTYYADADGDGFGNAAVTTQACSAPSGYVANNTDCNDSNSAIYPGATEVCNDIDDDCDGMTDEGCGGEPEIEVLGNSQQIMDGDDTPSIDDDTDYGNVSINNNTVVHTFTIHNAGVSDLAISSIGLSGANQTDFSLGALTPASPIPAGMNATFTLTFDPSAVGLRSATVTIQNNDADEGTFNFDLAGNGTDCPVFTACPTGPITVNTSNGQCTAPVTYTATATGTPAPDMNYEFNGATTGSGSGTGSGSTFNKGNTSVTVTASNTCEQEATCSFTVTVSDNEPPTITCQPPVTINASAGLCTGTTSLLPPTVSDNCLGIDNALSFDGNNDVVKVADNNLLDLNFPLTIEAWFYQTGVAFANIVVDKRTANDANLGYGIWLNDAKPAFYLDNNGNAGGGHVIHVSPNTLTTNAWHHMAAVYDGVRVKIYTDGVLTYNQAETNAITPTNEPLSIGDRNQGGQPFVGKLNEVRIWNVARTQAEIQANMNFELNAQAGLVAVYHLNEGQAGGNNAGVTDAPDVSGHNLNGTLNNFALSGPTSNWVSGQLNTAPAPTNDAPATFPTGNTIVTWTATDAAGNTASCQQTVTVTDNQPPIVTCPGGGGTVSFGQATSNADAIPAGSVYQSFTPAVSGSITSIAIQLVAPASNLILQVQSGSTCNGTVLGSKNFNGVAGLQTITFNTPIPVTGGVQYNFGVIGSHQIRWHSAGTYPGGRFYFNGCPGNPQFPNADILFTVNMTTGGPITLNTAPGTCTAAYTINDPISDNCAGATWGAVFSGNANGAPTNFSGIADGSNSSSLTFEKGSTTVALTASDASGSTATCSFVVIVSDNIAPVLTSPGNQSLNTLPDVCTANYTIADPVSHNCAGSTWGYTLSGATTGSASGIADGTSSNSIAFNKGVTTVVLSATDGTNAATTVSFTVTVTDNQPPTLTCPANITINTNPGLCTATTTLLQATATDNCPTTGNALDFDGSNDYISFANSLAGVTNFTYEAWVYPTAHQNWERILDFGNAPGQNIFFTSTANGGSGIPRFVINIGAGEQQLTAPSALVLNTWTHLAVTLDGSSAKMYVNGVLVATNNSFTYTPASLGNTVNNWIGRSQYNDAYFKGKIDEVRFWNVTRSQAEIQANMNVEIAPQPELIRCYRFNQGSAGGNNAGINMATDNTGNGHTGTLQNFALNGSTSNWAAGLLGSVSISNNAPANFPVGNTAVTWTATDANGNTATCSATVTVEDNQAPGINCPSNQSIQVDANCEGTLLNYTGMASGLSDNCTAVPTVAQSPAPGTTVNANTTVTFTAVDDHGNTGTCSFSVTLEDNVAPTIACPGGGPMLRFTDAGTCAYAVQGTEFNPESYGDNCTGTTIINDYNNTNTLAGAGLPVGATTIVWTVSDGLNTATCSIMVNVETAEIDVLGANINIVNGDVTPSLADGTDFGSVYLSNFSSKSFRIENNGGADLVLAANAISLGGLHPGSFSISGISLPATITPGNSTTFDVVFSPTTSGLKSATVNIANSDCDEGAYNFAVQGTGQVCSASVPSGTVFRWTNEGGDGLWSNADNWRNNSNVHAVPTAGSTAFFSCLGPANATLDVNTGIGSLIFEGSYTNTLHLGNYTLTLSSALTVPLATQLNAGTSLVVFNGSVTANSAASLYNLEIAGNSAVGLPQNLNIDNTLTLTSVSTIGQCTNGALRVKGNVVSNDADGWAPGGCGSWAYVSLVGNTDQTFSGTGKWANLDISKTGGEALMNANLDLVGNASLTGTAGAVLTNNGGILRGMGNLTFNYAGTVDDVELLGNGAISLPQHLNIDNTLTLSSVSSIGQCTNGALRVKGNVVSNDADGWAPGGCGSWAFLSLVGATDQTISGTGKWANLDISKTGGEALMNVNLDLVGNASLSGTAGAVLTNNGGILRGMGNLTFNYAGTVDDVELLGNGAISLPQHLNIDNTLTLSSVSSIGQCTNGALRVKGNVVSNDADGWAPGGCGSWAFLSLVGNTDQTLSGTGKWANLDISKTGGEALMNVNVDLVGNASLTGTAGAVLTNNGGILRGMGSLTFNYPGTVDDVELLGNGAISLPQHLNIDNMLTLTSVSSIGQCTNGALRVKGNVVSNDADGWAPGGCGSWAFLSLVGSTDQTLSGTGKWGNLDISKTGGEALMNSNVDLPGNATLVGNAGAVLTNNGGILRGMGSLTFNYPGTVDDLELLGNGAISLPQNLNIDNTLTLTSVSSMGQCTNGAIRVKGNVVSNDADGWAPGGCGSWAYLVLNGTGLQNISGSGKISIWEFAKSTGDAEFSGGFNTSFNNALVTAGTWNTFAQTFTSSGGFNASNGKIAGNGVLNGNVVLNSGGGIAPGASPGCLTVNGNVTFNGGSKYEVDLNSGNGVACTDFDRLIVNGNVTYNGTLFPAFHYAPAAGHSYQIVNASGSKNGNFAAITVTPSPGITCTFTPATGILNVTAASVLAWHPDVDNDGYGSSLDSLLATSQPSGYVLDHSDCNDNNNGVYPGATEICNGIDDDCDGQTDENTGATYYADADDDGFGDPGNSVQSCTQPSGYVTDNTDCNDNNNAVYPGATEVCNGIDDNCDGQTDEGVLSTFYADADNDTYGDPAAPIQACSAPSGYVADNADCDDSNSAINPTTVWYLDEDDDGFTVGSGLTQCASPGSGYRYTGILGAGDCDDNSATVYPGALEICGNSIDDNCDSQIDEGCADIEITGNNIVIAPGDNTPGLADGTEFGNSYESGQQIGHAFKIHNTGSSPLIVSNIAISGAGSANFLPPALSYPFSVPAGGDSTVIIKFDPTASGTFLATVTVSNNDIDEALYTFDVQGTGINCAITPPTGTVYRWTNNSGDGLWNNANNWRDNSNNPGVPTAGSTVFLSCLGSSDVTLNINTSVGRVVADPTYLAVLHLGAHTLTITQELKIPSASQLDAGTGLVQFNGTVTCNTPAELYNLEILGNGTITPAQNVLVGHNLTLTGVNIIGNCSSGNIEVKGNLISNDVNAWNAGSCGSWAYVVLTGSGNQTFSGTGKWSNLSVSKASGLVLMNSNVDIITGGNLTGTASAQMQNGPGRLRAMGNMTFNYAGTVDDVEFQGNGTIAVNQNLNVNDSLILTSVNIIGNCSNGNILVKGNLVSNDATGWASGSCGSWAYVVLNGSGNQTFSGTGKWANLDIKKTSGNVLLKSHLDFVSGATIKGLASSVVVSNPGRLRTGGNMTFDYAGTVEDVELLGTGTIALTQDLKVEDTLTISAVNIIGNCSNGNIQVKGNLISNDANAWSAGSCGSWAYVVLTGADDQRISGTGKWANLSVNKPSGLVWMSSNVDIISGGNLTGTAVAQMKNFPGRLRAMGNMTFNYAGTVDDVEFQGNGTIAVNQHLNVNDSLILTSVNIIGNCSNGNILVKGNLVSNDATGWASGSCGSWAYVVLTGSGNQTVAGTGKWANMEVNKPSGNVLLNSHLDFVSGATLKGVASSVVTSSPGRLRTGGNMTFDYAGTVDDVELLGNGTIALIQNLKVEDSLTVSAVNIIGNCSNGNIQVKGNLISNDATAWSAGSCGSWAYVVLTGSGNQQISGTGKWANLSVSKPSGSVLMNANVDIISGATLLGTATAQLQNNPGRFRTMGNATFNYAGTVDDVELQGNGTIALSQDFNVNDSLILTSVNRIGNCSNGNFLVKGNLVSNDITAWSAGSCGSWAYVVLNGTGNQRISGTGKWANLNVNKPSGVVLMDSNVDLVAGGTLLGTASAQIQNNPGRFRTMGNATFNYAGTVDDVELQGNGTITVSQDLNVNDSLILTAVNIMGNCSNGNIKVKGALVSNDANGWNAGSCGSVATVILNGNTDQTVSGTGQVYLLNVSKTGGNVLMPDNLDLQANGKLSGSGLIDNIGGVFNTVGNATFDFSGSIKDVRFTTNGGSRVITLNQDLQVLNTLTLAGAGAGFRITASPAGKKIKVNGNVSTEVLSWNSSTNAFICLTGNTDQSILTVGNGSLFKLDVSKTGGNVLMPADIWLYLNGELTGSGFFDNTGGIFRTLSGATFNFGGSIEDLRLAANNAIVTLKQDLQVNNSLIIDATPSGSFTLNANPAGKVLKVNGDVTTSATNWSAAATNNAYISLRGSTDQTLSGAGKIHRFEFAKPAGNALFSTASVKTFSGAAAVTAGNWDLLGNTFTSSTGGFTASGTGKLTGAGTLTGNVTVASGGGIAPGSPVGCMSITGNLAFQAGATYAVNLNGATTACTDFDRINVSGGTVAYAGTLQADFGYTPAVGATFPIANVTGGKTGNFAALVVTPNNITCSFAPATGILTVTGVAPLLPGEDRVEEETANADTPELKFRVYPSPAVETVNLDVSGLAGQSADLMIYDQSGRLLWHYRLDGTLDSEVVQLSVKEAGLSGGVYTLVLRSGTKTVSKRLIVTAR